jgi:hypothetical protein
MAQQFISLLDRMKSDFSDSTHRPQLDVPGGNSLNTEDTSNQ